MKRRIDVAHGVLSDLNRRKAYRREAYPLDYESASELGEQRVNAASSRPEMEGAKPNRPSSSGKL